jgi:hypothetical protein
MSEVVFVHCTPHSDLLMDSREDFLAIAVGGAVRVCPLHDWEKLTLYSQRAR